MAVTQPIDFAPIQAYEPHRIDAGIGELSTATALAIEAMVAANDPPQIFIKNNELVRVVRDEQRYPLIQPLGIDGTRGFLARAANYYKTRDSESKGRVETAARPPLDVVRDLHQLPNKPFPALLGIIEAPIFAATGELHNMPGYHPATQRYLLTGADLFGLEVPRRPTDADLAGALALLIEDLYGDFPFASDADRAHALALLVTLFARELVDAPVPLFLFDKSTPGTGATLLLECAHVIATGRRLVAMTVGLNPEESAKKLAAVLRNGPMLTAIDNANQLAGEDLACILTTSTFEPRILGFTETIRVPVRTVFAASGNNVSMSTEIVSRVVSSRLDAKMEHPEERSGFRHPDLIPWTLQHRAELVRAVLTLIMAWLDRSRPAGTVTHGRFPAWSRVVGGVLEVARVPGFLGNLKDLRAVADSEAEIKRAFIEEWHAKFGTARTAAADLFALATGIDLGNGGERSQRIRLGKYLSKMRGQVIGSVRVERAGVSSGQQMWQLVAEVGF